MTLFEYEQLCGELLLDPATMLEHSEVLAAIQAQCTASELTTILNEIA